MVSLGNKKIYLYGNDISLKLGIDGLTEVIKSNFTEEEMDNSLFIFFSKDRKQVKIMEYDKYGAWLYNNKLDGYRFLPPTVEEGRLKLTREQLEIILKNIKLVGRR